MKKIFEEFKKFAFKGNALDMAVGVVIGAAFSSIVGLLVRTDFTDLKANIFGVNIAYGSFIMQVINFLIVAFALFMLVKSINKVTSLGKKEVKEEPTTKKCTFCLSEIPIKATRCPHCTSELPQIVTKKEAEQSK